MRFPPEFIERLRNHIPISEVVGKRVAIRKHGREYQGLCPFHKEKSPSFTVNDEKGFFHCFGCAAHGDAIGFIKDFEGVSYVEAVERLAGEAGLPIPAMTQESREYERKRHTLEDAVALAAQWFMEQLQTPAAREARDYLTGRGLTAETLTRFDVGFAPNSRDAFKNALMKQNISEAMLIEAGLLATPDTGASYDRFRGRIMFPIRNAQSKVVAFGGRIMPGMQSDKIAKYINSPETPLFKKGDMLFAYNIAGRNVRGSGSLIVAEGYMDVIALHQAGFDTAVAPLGTAITEQQLRLLWRISPTPIICLDGDEAGHRAMWRAAELALPLLKPEMSLRFAILQGGEDPDSLIRKNGPGAMQQTLAQAKILSQVLRDYLLKGFESASPEKKSAMENQLMQMADRIADATIKRHYQEYFRNEIYALKRWKKNAKQQAVSPDPIPPLPEAKDDNSHLKSLENQLVTLILLHPDILHHSDIEEHFGHMDFLQPVLDKLGSDILEISAYQELINSDALREVLGGRGHAETVEMLLQYAARSLPRQTYTQWQTEPSVALAAWRKTFDAYTDKIENREIAHLMALGSDDAYHKISALNKQKEERRRAHYAVTSDEQSS